MHELHILPVFAVPCLTMRNVLCLCSSENSEQIEEESCLLETRRTYATGLLAIALTRTEVCDEAVRSGIVARMVQVGSHSHHSLVRVCYYC